MHFDFSTLLGNCFILNYIDTSYKQYLAWFLKLYMDKWREDPREGGGCTTCGSQILYIDVPQSQDQLRSADDERMRKTQPSCKHWVMLN